MKPIRLGAVFLTFLMPAAAFAEDTSTLLKNSFYDGGYLVTSPLRLTCSDVPLGLGIAALIGGSMALDRTVRISELPTSTSSTAESLRHFGDIAQFSGPILGGGFAVTGWSFHDDRQKEVSWDLFESFAWANVFSGGFKLIVGRKRPNATDDPFEFKPGSISDSSFPSGHTTSAFAAATTISAYYPDWKVIVPAYSVATAVGFSRVYSNKHWLSDVVAGAFLGTGVSYGLFKRRKKRFETAWNFNVTGDGLALSRKF